MLLHTDPGVDASSCAHAKLARPVIDHRKVFNNAGWSATRSIRASCLMAGRQKALSTSQLGVFNKVGVLVSGAWLLHLGAGAMTLHEEAKDNSVPQAHCGSALQGPLGRRCALCSRASCAMPRHMLQDGRHMLSPISRLAAELLTNLMHLVGAF